MPENRSFSRDVVQLLSERKCENELSEREVTRRIIRVIFVTKCRDARFEK